MVQFVLAGLLVLATTLLGACSDVVRPGDAAGDRRLASKAGMHFEALQEAAGYAGGSGIVLRGGQEAFRWGDTEKLYDLKSTTKSIGSLALGIALDEGRIALSDRVAKHFPGFGVPPEGNRRNGWLGEITFFHLATHTSGFDFHGGYQGLLFPPGTAWAYSDCGTNWLADTLTFVYRRDLKDLFFDRILIPLGVSPKDFHWRPNRYREPQMQGVIRRELGSGMHASVRTMAKFGELMLREGNWKGRQIVGPAFVRKATGPWGPLAHLPVTNDPQAKYAGAPTRYGLLWWHNSDRTMAGVPSDAFWSWGLHDSTIAVIPSLDLVIARAGKSPAKEYDLDSRRFLERFFGMVVAAVDPRVPFPGRPLQALPETPKPAAG